MRVLGLDYGLKRLGVAVSDELGITAQSLLVIERKNEKKDLEAIARIIHEYHIEKIVIGYPLLLDGSKGIQCEKVDRYAERLSAEFNLPVIKWDETLSTWEADELMSEAGVKRRKRKKLVDKIAAGIMLQSYLDRLK
jgi:putative Holliday junction resolvase